MEAPAAAPPPQILETTLRDGTYEVDFQFSVEDTAFLAAALDRAGFSYIEVSHGNGTGTERWAVRPRSPRPLADDAAHITAAARVVTRAKLAAIMVVGPKFTPPDELERLRSLGISVVRLAFEWFDVADPVCLAYIDRAKALGLTVSINIMQTYYLTLDALAAASREMARRGADWLYVVDSAGGMSGKEVAESVRAVREASGLRVGLHAHNNSGLAIANSLAALDAGASLVDTTLQGIGRATGNPSTEQILLALQKRGHERGIDRELTLKLGDLARALFAEKGNDPTHFVSGAGSLHSRNLAPLLRTAAERGVPARELLIQVGQRVEQRGKPPLDGEAMARFAAGVPVEHKAIELPAPVFEILGRGVEQRAHGGLARASDELFARGRKRRKRTALYLAPAAQLFFDGVEPWESAQLVGATVPRASGAALSELPADRVPDLIAYDPAAAGDAALAALPGVHLSLPLAPLVAEAVVDLVVGLGARTVALRGDDAVTRAIAPRLAERGLARGDDGEIIVTTVLDAALVEACRAGVTVVLCGRGADRGAVAEARRRGARVLRPLLPPVLAARIEAAAALRARLAAALDGERTAPSPPGVVDALTAPAGHEVVVDALASPTAVLDCEPAELGRAAVEVARRRVASWLDGKGSL